MESCGSALKEAWREEGRKAGKKDPYWTRLFPIGPVRVPWANKEEVDAEWIGDEGIIIGEVFGDGSVKGRGEMRRGGSAFGVLRCNMEEAIVEQGEDALVGAWIRLGGRTTAAPTRSLGRESDA